MPDTTDKKRSHRSEPGTAPGLFQVDPDAHETHLRGFRISATNVEELTHETLTTGEDPRQPGTFVWINADGLGDADLLSGLAAQFDLHPLAVEDVVTLDQRAKVEEFECHLFFILRMPETVENGRFRSEQVSVFLGDGFVITLQEYAGDVFEPVRARLRNPARRIRARDAGYLAYALTDAVIDSYFPILEDLSERIELLEDEVVSNPRAGQISEIHDLKRELMAVRAVLWPMRDMVSSMMRDEFPRFNDATTPYLRDCRDHLYLLIDMIETHRETTSGLVDIHLSSQSNQMNQVMQVLTLVSTIFIPLTFIAGVYGMNFDPEISPWNMPELSWRYGYPIVMGVMAVIAVALALWFRSLGWLGRKKR